MQADSEAPEVWDATELLQVLCLRDLAVSVISNVSSDSDFELFRCPYVVFSKRPITALELEDADGCEFAK